MAASKDAISRDTEFQEMMKYSLKFWMYNLAKSNAMNGISTTTEVQHVLTWYQKALYGADAVLALLTVLFIVLGVKKSKKIKEQA